MIDDEEWQYDITARGTWKAVRFLIKHPRLAISTIPELLEVGLSEYLVTIATFAHILREAKKQEPRKP